MIKWKDRSPTWKSFRAAKRRCLDPNIKDFANYGGRGIKFKLEKYQDIIAEIGERPEGATLDRIDTNGHYEIGNIRWATRVEQERNKRNFKMVPEMVEMVKKLRNAGFSYRDIYFKTGLRAFLSIKLALKGHFDGK